MKQSIYIYLMLILFIYSCMYKQNNNIGIINPSPYDWGEMSIKDTIKIHVSYINKMTKTVTIDYIDTPCGCIIAIPRKFIIEKGDSTIIDIDFVPLDYGYTEKNLFLYFKEMREPLHFMIKGKIRKTSI